LITKNTVFILGAGASVPYGYPTGFNLSQEIKISLQNVNTGIPEIREDLLPLFNELGYGTKELMEFYECFLNAATYSVDKFLENRPDFEVLGKLLIAYFLKRKENSHQLFIGLRESNWYAELFNRLDVIIYNIKNYKISFITFNYDRSLEFFLHSFLKNRTTRNSKDILDALSCIPIVHVYGSLGNLPWEQDNGIDYDYKVNPSQIKRMAEGIDIMSGEKDSVQLKRAQKLLLNSHYIYFIGFGYDKTNLRRLKIHDLTNVTEVIKGTSIGIDQSRQREIYDFLHIGSYPVFIADNQTEIMEFLENFVIFQ